uniref:RdRp n=4 Tax=Statovirus TaxID=1964815 RepID=A0A1U9WUH4_9VIRU|nr:RdRp [Statovirus A4]
MINWIISLINSWLEGSVNRFATATHISGLRDFFRIYLSNGPLGLFGFTMIVCIIFVLKIIIVYKMKIIHARGRNKITVQGYSSKEAEPDEYVPNPTSVERREVPKEIRQESDDSWRDRLTKFVGFKVNKVNETHFPLGVEDIIDGVPDKVCLPESRRGFRVNELVKDTNITTPFLSLPGNEYRRFKNFCTINVPESYNDHVHTSLVKNYLTALIAKLDLNTMSISYEPWLSHTGSNGSYLVTALHGKVINDYMSLILRCNLPCLFVVEDYHEGLHYDKEYAYICNNGHVTGISRGVKSTWYDENTRYFINECGNVGTTHKYTTLIRYGSQRLILLELGQTVEIPLYEHKVKTLHYERCVVSPNDKCYLPALCAEIIDKEVNTMPQFKTKFEILAPHRLASMICFITGIVEWCFALLDLILDFGWFSLIKLILGFPWPTTVFSQSEFVVAMMFPGFYGVYSTVRYWLLPRFGLCRMCVDIGFDELYIKGKYAEAFYDHLHSKDIGVDGLPYGFYYVDNFNLIRVPPGTIENYTNLINVVRSFNTANGHNASNIPAKFNELFGHNNINFDDQLAGAVTPPVISQIPTRMTVVDYSLNIKMRDTCNYHLLSDLEYCKYGSSALTHDVAAGAASNRVLQPTLPQPNPDVFFKMCVEFWDKFESTNEQNTFLNAVDLFPEIIDLDHYTGKKRARMECGYMKHKKGAFYSTFMKNEALPLSTINEKAVRVISPNTAAFNAEHREFFHAFEEHLLNITYSDGKRMFAKGLNYDDRYDIIQDLVARYKYCCCCDFSNFDAHHRNNSYMGELLFYKYLGLRPETVRQLATAVKGGNIAYSLPSRCSGDLFTGSGNCLIIAALFTSFSNEIRIFCDGDDTLVFSNSPDTGRLLVDYMKSFGFVLKVDKTVTDYESQSIDFCQVRYWPKRYMYNIDFERRINKAMNFKADSIEEAVRITRGKLESLLPLTQLGVQFKMPGLQEIIPHIPITSEDVWYWTEAVKGQFWYQPEKKVVIDLEEDSGLLAKLCQKLIQNKAILLGLTVKQRTKEINKIIQTTLMEVSTHYVLEEKNCGLQSVKWGTYLLTSIGQLTHNGSAKWQICTKTMRCMKLGSIGLVPIQSCQPVASLSVTTPILMISSVMKPQSCSHNKEPEVVKSVPMDKSQSQETPSPKHQAKDHAEDKTHGSLNSSPKLKPKKTHQSKFSSNTTSRSESHSSAQKQSVPHSTTGVQATVQPKNPTVEPDSSNSKAETSLSSKSSSVKSSKSSSVVKPRNQHSSSTTETVSEKSSTPSQKVKKIQGIAVLQNALMKQSMIKAKACTKVPSSDQPEEKLKTSQALQSAGPTTVSEHKPSIQKSQTNK